MSLGVVMSKAKRTNNYQAKTSQAGSLPSRFSRRDMLRYAGFGLGSLALNKAGLSQTTQQNNPKASSPLNSSQGVVSTGASYEESPLAKARYIAKISQGQATIDDLPQLLLPRDQALPTLQQKPKPDLTLARETALMATGRVEMFNSHADAEWTICTKDLFSCVLVNQEQVKDLIDVELADDEMIVLTVAHGLINLGPNQQYSVCELPPKSLNMKTSFNIFLPTQFNKETQKAEEFVRFSSVRVIPTDLLQNYSEHVKQYGKENLFANFNDLAALVVKVSDKNRAKLRPSDIDFREDFSVEAFGNHFIHAGCGEGIGPNDKKTANGLLPQGYNPNSYADFIPPKAYEARSIGIDYITHIKNPRRLDGGRRRIFWSENANALRPGASGGGFFSHDGKLVALQSQVNSDSSKHDNSEYFSTLSPVRLPSGETVLLPVGFLPDPDDSDIRRINKPDLHQICPDTRGICTGTAHRPSKRLLRRIFSNIRARRNSRRR